MKVAVCFNKVPPKVAKGEALDLLAEKGSQTEAKAVSKSLKELGHKPTLLALENDPLKFGQEIRKVAPDAVFNLCEGFWGESRKEMHVAAVIDLLGIPYTGSAPLCLGLTQDKARTKDLLMRHGLPTPKYVLIKMGELFPKTKELTYPLIVKPRFEDASLGITSDSIVSSEKALLKRIEYIHTTYRQGALIEEFIEGRELNAAVLGSAPYEILPISEIRFEQGLKHSIVSYAGKWQEETIEYAKTKPLCPAPLKAREELLVRDVSLRACRLLETRDYARVDIRLRDGVPYILEINANPDISPGAGLSRSARAAGMTYNDLIARILTMTMKRHEVPHATR